MVSLVAFWLAGFVQSVTGFGAALVAVPLLALVLGPGDAVVTITLVSLVLTGWASVRERGHVDVPAARQLTLAGLVGMPFGLALLAWASDLVLEALMAVTVLAALVLVSAKVRAPAGAATGRITGLLSGVLLTSTGMNGPPLVLGLLARQPDPRRFRGTLQVVLCVQDAAAAVGFLVIGHLHAAALAGAALGLLACPLGWLVGDLLFDRIPAGAFHRVVAAGLAASALLLLVSHVG